MSQNKPKTLNKCATKLKELKVRLGDKWSKSFGNYAIKLSAEETKWMARVPEPPSLFFTVWF